MLVKNCLKTFWIEPILHIDKYFEKDISNNTKSHIYLGDIKLATVNNTSTPYYVISDHLSSNNLVTDNSGNVIETSDYEPYGKISYSNVVQNTDNQYRFTGQELDTENNLQYYEARYLGNDVARFYSVDPAILVLHDGQKLKEITQQGLEQLLSNPQILNSYSYSLNNPVIFVDQDGQFAGPFGRSLASGQRTIASFLHRAADYTSNRGGIINKASGFVTNEIGKLFDKVANLYNPDQKASTRVFALGMVALDASTGGEGKFIGQSFGKLGTVVKNIPGKITGIFTRANGEEHALMRILTRSASIEDIAGTVNTPLITLRQAGGNILYLSRQAGVVLNKAGEIVTVYGKREFNSIISNLLKNIK